MVDIDGVLVSNDTVWREGEEVWKGCPERWACLILIHFTGTFLSDITGTSLSDKQLHHPRAPVMILSRTAVIFLWLLPAVNCPGRIWCTEDDQGGWVRPAVQSILCEPTIIRGWLYAALVQERKEDRVERERLTNDKEGRGGRSCCVLRQVECDQGCVVEEVG